MVGFLFTSPGYERYKAWAEDALEKERRARYAAEARADLQEKEADKLRNEVAELKQQLKTEEKQSHAEQPHVGSKALLRTRPRGGAGEAGAAVPGARRRTQEA